MIAISKGMIALSAVISAGIVAAVDFAHTRPTETPATVIDQRFPRAGEMFVQVSKPGHIAAPMANAARKGDRLPITTECTEQGWPYISPRCLVTKDGKPVRQVSRVITVERRIDANTSALVRMPVTEVAQRLQ